MSTRSRIGIINSNGTITSIYCHHDGYPSGVGDILYNFYLSTKKIRELMSLGNISSLGPILGEKHDFDMHTTYSWKNAGKAGTAPSELGWCNAYGRDRGETDEDVKSEISGNRDEFLLLAKDCWADYAYLWDIKHNKWLIRFIHAEDGKWVKLTEKIIKEEEN